VLYFDNLSRDSSDLYLADGLTEELIARLGQLERLQLKSRNAVRRYRGAADVDPTAVGRALGVAYLVSGSVRRSGARLRVTVEMVRATTGLRVWGDQYDRAETDALAIQEDVARAVATAIAGRLAPAERQALAAGPTRNPAAYDHYLRANFYLRQRQAAVVARAIAEYERAAILDSTFAAAAAGAATAYYVWMNWGWEHPTLSRDSLLARGFAWAERAVRVNPSSGPAWRARGNLLRYRYPKNPDSALAALERAVSLDPRDAESRHFLALALAFDLQDSAAVAGFRHALALEPRRPITLHSLAWFAENGRRYDEARGLLDSALAVDPSFHPGYLRRAQIWLLLGDPAAALRDVEKAAGLVAADPIRQRTTLTEVMVALGDTIAARALIDSVLAPVPSDSFAGTWAAVAYALVALGDHERAIALMEAVHQHTLGREFAFWSRFPQLDPIRSDPRFLRLVEQARGR